METPPRMTTATAVAVALLCWFAGGLEGGTAATVTWIGGFESNNNEGSSWSTGHVPTSSDECVVNVNGKPASAVNPDDENGANDDTTVVFRSDLSCGSISVRGTSVLRLESIVDFATAVTIEEGAELHLAGGSLVCTAEAGRNATVIVNGRMAFDSGRVGASEGARVTITVAPKAGEIEFGVGGGSGNGDMDMNDGGANQLVDTVVRVGGTVKWERNPLILDRSIIEVGPSGRFMARGPSLSYSDPKVAGSIVNRGTTVFDGSTTVESESGSTQSIGVIVTSSGVMNVTGGANVVFLNTVSVDGALNVDAASTIALAGRSHELTIQSKTMIEGSMLVRSGTLLISGAATVATLSIQSPTVVNGKLRSGSLTLQSGKLECTPAALCEAEQLVWRSGTLSGGGTLHVSGPATFSDPASTKQLATTLMLHGNSTVEQDCGVLFSGGKLLVTGHNAGSPATLINAAGSSMNLAGNNGSLIQIDQFAEWRITAPVMVAVEVKAKGPIIVAGAGMATFRASIDVDTLRTDAEDVTVRLTGSTQSTMFTVSNSLSMRDGDDLLVETGKLVFGRPDTGATLGKLALRNSQAVVPNAMRARTVEIGSEASTASMMGGGSLLTEVLMIRAGGVSVASVTARNLSIPGSNNAKDIYSPNLSVSGVSRLSGPGFIRFGPNVRFHVLPSAVVFVDRGADFLDMSRTTAGASPLSAASARPKPQSQPAANESDEAEGAASSAAMAALPPSAGLINLTGVMVFSDQSKVSIALLNDGGALVLGESGSGGNGVNAGGSSSGGVVSFSAGVTSSDSSSVTVKPSSTLMCSCPTGMQCTWPSINGGGALVLQTGETLFGYPISVSGLTVTGGKHQLLSRISTGSTRLTEGTVQLYAPLVTQTLDLKGGALLGFDILRSMIILTKSGTVAISSGTCNIRGVDLVVDGVLDWVKGDLLLSEDGDLATTSNGTIHVRGPVKIIAGDATGKVLNGGQFTISNGASFMSGVPIRNRGKFSISGEQSIATAASGFSQDHPNAMLSIGPGSRFVKPSGFASVSSGTLDNIGRIDGSVQLGGTIHAQPLARGHEMSVVRGDFIMGPTALLKLTCAPDGLDCTSLNVTGTLFAGGRSEVRFANASSTSASAEGAMDRVGSEYRIARASRMLGRLQSYVVDAGGNTFNPHGESGFVPRYSSDSMSFMVVPAESVRSPEPSATSEATELAGAERPALPIANASSGVSVSAPPNNDEDEFGGVEVPLPAGPSPFEPVPITPSTPSEPRIRTELGANVALEPEKGNLFGMHATNAETAFIICLVGFVIASLLVGFFIAFPDRRVCGGCCPMRRDAPPAAPASATAAPTNPTAAPTNPSTTATAATAAEKDKAVTGNNATNRAALTPTAAAIDVGTTPTATNGATKSGTDAGASKPGVSPTRPTAQQQQAARRELLRAAARAGPSATVDEKKAK